jgi:flavodoxin/ferredoxin
MSSILILFFSETGTTNKIAEYIKNGLTDQGHLVNVYNMNDSNPPDPRDFDVIGIGSPTYVFRTPFLVKDFVNSLPNLSGKKFFTFVLYGTFQGDSGNWIRKKMKMKGAKDLGYFKSHGADYFIGYVKHGYLFSPNSPTDNEKQGAILFGHILADRIKKANWEVEPMDPSPQWVYRLERHLTSRIYAKHIYSRLFFANKTCDSCGICWNVCPTQNIKEDPNGFPSWGRECLFCARCEITCPKDAITSPYDWLVFKPLISFNINQARKKEITYIRVRHDHGETIPV